MPLTAQGYQYVFYTSATLQWAALPTPPSSSTCEGYLLEASTTNFGNLAGSPGGLVLSSATTSWAANHLSIDFTNNGTSGLDSYSTWYFLIGGINWNNVWNPSTMTQLNMEISTSIYNLSMGSINPAVFQSSVSISSLVVTNVGNIAATYNIWASTLSPCLWQLGTSQGVEQAVLQGQWNSLTYGPSSASFGAIGTNDILLTTATSRGAGGLYYGNQSGAQVAPGASATLWFQFWVPTATADKNAESIIVGVAPTYP
jgi:hypothetical protein